MKKIRSLNLIAGGTWQLPFYTKLFSDFLDSSRKKVVCSITNNNYKNNEQYFGYDTTLYRFGHLSMNPREEPFLGDDA